MTLETMTMLEPEIDQFAKRIDDEIGVDYEVNDFGDGEWGITVFDIESRSERDLLCKIEIDIVGILRHENYWRNL